MLLRAEWNADYTRREGKMTIADAAKQGYETFKRDYADKTTK